MRIITPAVTAAFGLALALPFAAAQAQAITTDELALLDTNGDGVVSVEEFDIFVEQSFVTLDANGDGFLVWTEVEQVIPVEIFTAADIDGNNGLSMEEYQAQAAADFAAADLDNDGALN